MSAVPDFLRLFHELEQVLEAEPEWMTGEIAHGIYHAFARPRPRHGRAQVALAGELLRRFGGRRGGDGPDWLFVIEPEIRKEEVFSRLAPDIAAWRKSKQGWPDPDVTPIELMPEWVAEILSPSTARFDRREKTESYGAMGVGWLWLVDPRKRTIEALENVRGQMVPREQAGPGGIASLPPFRRAKLPLDQILAY